MYFSFEQLRSFPWATIGRPEAPVEFLAKCKEQQSRVSFLKAHPMISLIIPVTSSTPLDTFSLTLECLRAQSYPYWEAIFVTPSGAPAKSAELLLKSRGESRFHWLEGESSDLASLKNEGVARSQGTWWGIVDPGDVLSPAALYQLVLDMEALPEADLFYSNEAFLSEDYRRVEKFIGKPEYSWFNLIHFNYVGRFWLVRKGGAWQSLRFDTAAADADEHDFLLQLVERGARFHLSPYYHYYRLGPSAGDAPKETLGIVQRHLGRKKFKAEVRVKDGKIKIKPSATDGKDSLVSAVICFRDHAAWMVSALESLIRQAGDVPLEIFLVNNQSRPEERAIVAEAAKKCVRPATIIDYDDVFNYAKMHNHVFRNHANGRFFLFLNNDVSLTGEKGLEEMVSWVQFPWVGTVGIVLRFPDGRLQHAGFRALYGGESRLARIGNSREEGRFLSENREVFGSTFAACLVKSETMESIGGLSETECANGFGDVIFSFECLRRQLHNVLLGHIEGVHRESASRGLGYEYWEEYTIERRYPDLLQKMLRCDLGENRVPGGDFPFRSLARQAVSHRVAKKFPWILPLKPPIRKALRWFSKT